MPPSRPAGILASSAARATAWSAVSVAGAGAPVSRDSVLVTRTTVPARTATATRPSLPAGRLPNFCCSSTVAPAPRGLTETVVRPATAAASRPNSAVLRLRYSFAAVAGSLDRPDASGPGPSAAGVPNAFHRTRPAAFAAADACAAVGRIVPLRLSTSPGPARFAANPGSAAAGPPAPAGAALATPFVMAATSATTATPVPADTARRRAVHPQFCALPLLRARVAGTANQTNRAVSVGPSRVSRNEM